MMIHLITAATGGIGQAICHELTARGDKVIIAARDLNKAQQLQQALPQGLAMVVEIDYCRPESFAQLAELQFQSLVLMPPRIAPTYDVLPDDSVWQQNFDLCFIKPLALLKAALPVLKQQQKSHVAVISGISSKHALPHYALNNAIRSAWLGQAKSLALALGESGVRVNTLSLGGVMTESYQQKLAQKAQGNGLSFSEQMQQEVSNVPLSRYAEPVDIAKAVAALFGDLAMHMSGQNIVLDGGFFRGY